MTLPGFTAAESLYTSTRHYAGATTPGGATDAWGIEPALSLSQISELESSPGFQDLLAAMPKPDPVREACCKKCWDGRYDYCFDEPNGECSCWHV